MAKTTKAPTTQYVCTECGYVTPKWLGKCPACNEFNTLQEELIAPEAPVALGGKTGARMSVNRASPLSKVVY